MGRKPCCDKVVVKRGPWTPEEDAKLVTYIQDNGLGCWRSLPKLAGMVWFSSIIIMYMITMCIYSQD